MADRFIVTESSLREAMRDDRYWHAGHPERNAYVNWVGEGFQALVRAEQAGDRSVVHVRAYSRVRDGRTEHVSDHLRSAPPRGDEDGVTLAQAPFLLTPRAPLVFSRPPVGRIPMERVARQSGKESARDVPSWARGMDRYVGETPARYAERLMNERYGPGNWADRPREFSQIKKYGSRHFRDPSGAGPFDVFSRPEA